MSLGNRIVLTPVRGYPIEGVVNTGETFYPGMIVQLDPTQATIGNRYVHALYNRSADGDRTAGPAVIVREDLSQGKTMSDSYAAGEHFFGFIPLSGCELNLLYKNVTGTADDVLAGDVFIADDGTGKFIVTTGTPQDELAMALEAVTDPTADTLVHSIWR